MHNLESQVLHVIQAAHVRSLLVAVSGGADSVALLAACSRRARRLSLRIEAVNCNFHLRGAESDRDSKFTASLCHTLGVKLHAIDYDVAAYMKANPGVSTEMACRALRYADFFRIMKEEGFDRVAVAHNADDDIETLMLNMLRGSGTRGLKGMDVDNGRVVRPLLGISRQEIEEYLKSLNLDYITDSSNLSSEFRRNFIRREVLPLLESRWPGARKTMSKTVSILKEESAIIEDFYRNQLEKFSPQKNTLLIYNDSITIGTVLRFLEPFEGTPEIAEEIMEATRKDFKERTWKLSDRYNAILERDRLIIADSKEPGLSPELIWTELPMSPATMENVKGNRNHNIVYLPSSSDAYTLRLPQTGDRMSPLGMRGSRLISDIISDARLDRRQKAMVRVLERNSDGEIIWVTGLKRSRHDLISPDSPSCFKAEYRPY